MSCTPQQLLKGAARSAVAHRFALAVATAGVMGAIINLPMALAALAAVGIAMVYTTYENHDDTVPNAAHHAATAWLEKRRGVVFFLAFLASTACAMVVLSQGVDAFPSLHQDPFFGAHPIGTTVLVGSLAMLGITMAVMLLAMIFDGVVLGMRHLCDQGTHNA